LFLISLSLNTSTSSGISFNGVLQFCHNSSTHSPSYSSILNFIFYLNSLALF
jgi:hypothetical protein